MDSHPHGTTTIPGTPPEAHEGARWHERPVVAFDTETTGIDVTHDRIVTAALVRGQLPDDGVPGGATTWLVDPGVEIPAAATAVHGITTAQARAGGRPPLEALVEIAGALTSAARAGENVVVFNASYDLALLDAELARHGLATLAQRLDGTAMTVVDPLVLDRALDRYRRGKRTLAHLCEVYDVTVTEELHSADADARVTLEVLAQMVRRFPELTELDQPGITAFQRTAHEQWATGFNTWRQERGIPGDPVSAVWP